MQRNLTLESRIDSDGKISNRLLLIYFNKSETELFPGGIYRNYMRFLVPKDAEIDRVLINATPLDSKKIDRAKINNYASFGFLIVAPIQKETRVEVVYHRTAKIKFTSPIDYQFYLQKQSGLADDKFTYKLSLPSDVATFSVKPQALHDKDSYVFSAPYDRDLIFEAYLTK
jgi:hypothetical protein